jgi:hypothetical protein
MKRTSAPDLNVSMIFSPPWGKRDIVSKPQAGAPTV